MTAQQGPGERQLPALWLVFARIAWIGLVAFTAILFATGLPIAFQRLAVPCADARHCVDFQLFPQDVRLLQQAGLSLQF